MRNRAGIILIEEEKLALIERHRSGLHYFAFPGGGIDEGESAEETAEGTYLPLWMRIEDVLNNNVLPREVAELVARSHQQGWNVEPVIILEEKK